MKVKELINILYHYGQDDEVTLDLDNCKSPDEFIFEEEQTVNILKITQGNCGL
jgi:hypothetical protein